MNPQSKVLSVTGHNSVGQQPNDVNIFTSPTNSEKDTTRQSEIHTSSPDLAIDTSKKTSPTSQSLISDLKTVNVDRSLYKHYGHQSLLTSQSLELIILEGKKKEKEEEEEEEEEERRKKAGYLLNPCKKKSHDETKDSPKTSLQNDLSSKESLQFQLSQILNINTKEDIPFDSDTINEILKLKIEQEITKQQHMKNENMSTMLRILQLARTLEISAELIPSLFSNNSIASPRGEVTLLSEHPYEFIKKIENAAKKQAEKIKCKPMRLDSRVDKSFVNGVLQQNIASAGSSVLVSPITSFNKLPLSSCCQSKSEPNEKEFSPPLVHSKPVLLPLPGTNHQNQMQQILPSKHPLYYTPPSATNGLGSPYQQAVQPNIAHPELPQPIGYSQQTISQKPLQYYLPQKSAPPVPPYQYYIATTPPQSSQPPDMIPQLAYTSNYPPPNPIPSNSSPKANVSSHPVNGGQYSESDKSKAPGGGSILRFDKEEAEDFPPPKRSKLNVKNSSINFMISTPENPPAKRYNHNSRP